MFVHVLDSELVVHVAFMRMCNLRSRLCVLAAKPGMRFLVTKLSVR